MSASTQIRSSAVPVLFVAVSCTRMAHIQTAVDCLSMTILRFIAASAREWLILTNLATTVMASLANKR